jgi:DNA-binding GntR family transcriptional regulator
MERDRLQLKIKNRYSLADRVYDYLQHEIIAGILESGQRLKEPKFPKRCL